MKCRKSCQGHDTGVSALPAERVSPATRHRCDSPSMGYRAGTLHSVRSNADNDQQCSHSLSACKPSSPLCASLVRLAQGVTYLSLEAKRRGIEVQAQRGRVMRRPVALQHLPRSARDVVRARRRTHGWLRIDERKRCVQRRLARWLGAMQRALEEQETPGLELGIRTPMSEHE